MTTAVMLYPGHSAEDDYDVLARALPGTHLPVVHTWEGPTAHDVAALRELGAREQLLPAAQEARKHDPGAVVWACTSGSFVYGVDGVVEQARWVEEGAGVPGSSTSLSFVEALRHLGATRVSVAATYPADVTAHLTALLEANGVAVLAQTSGDVPSGEDAGRLGPDEVTELVLGGGHPDDADVVLVPDTALHTAALLTALEEQLGRPVLTANQVSAWHGLRLAGWRGTATGLGRLFAA